MMTISEIIQKLHRTFPGGVELRFLHPTLYIVCVDARFEGASAEERQKLLGNIGQFSVDDLRVIRSIGVAELYLLTPAERAEDDASLGATNEGQHWLAWFTPSEFRGPAPILHPQSSKVVHFYGFKGGQARSTVLVLLAKALADAGYRVLVVDADVEAPSLDTILGVAADSPSATLMGLCGWADEVTPVAKAYAGEDQTGYVDLLACRPRSKAYDMDFAAFLLNASLNAKTLEQAATNLQSYVAFSEDGSVQKYDVVFFDHRTGLAPSILPIMKAWPGPAVVFTRLDAMSSDLPDTQVFDILLSHDTEIPGAFVTLSLQPNASRETIREAHGRTIERLLVSLSDAFARVSDEGEIDPLALEPHWIVWHYDPALLAQLPPAPKGLSSQNQQSLFELREILGLEESISPRLTTPTPKLTRSGATDEGWFIRTQDVDRLFTPNSQFLYILGRKGTGKTRLLRELQAETLGEPLLVASDYKGGGLQSLSVAFRQLFAKCGEDGDLFWWALLRAALECRSTYDESLEKKISDLCSVPNFDAASYGSVEDVVSTVRLQSGPRTFLVDGVETAVSATHLRAFVESLFKFMSTIQFDRFFDGKVTVRVFLRLDLAIGASENVDQQMEGRQLRLSWDKTSILNFVLARIATLQWFRDKFPAVCLDIEKNQHSILRGSLEEKEAEELLLRIFPRKLERNKLKTTTFFASYFSDSGDAANKASFYPRLFDNFLRRIDASARNEEAGKEPLKDDLLNSPFVLGAYDSASEEFISDVRDELYALLDLAKDASENRGLVNRFIDSFSGRRTPFLVEEEIANLGSSLNISIEKIRASMVKMKDLGVFEERDGYPGYWRSGRIYKSGLKMKYVRAQTPRI